MMNRRAATVVDRDPELEVDGVHKREDGRPRSEVGDLVYLHGKSIDGELR